MKFSYILMVACLLVLSTGCKQDFDVTADYKEVPVVYGLLNYTENVHYLRIQKGYLVDGNALLAAGVPDSIYYSDDLTVKLQPLVNGTANGSPYILKKVDGDTLNPPLPKDSGVFAQSPNILYRFTGFLDPAKKYRLEINNPASGKSITSETALVRDFEIVVPTKASKLNLGTTNPTKLVFANAENAGVYDLTVRFHYKEYNQSDNSLIGSKYVDIKLFQSLGIDFVDGNNVITDLSGEQIFRTLANNITANANVYREFDITKGMVFTYAAGGTDLARYLNAQAAQSGLVSNEALPVFTNISDGVGLFSSRYIKSVDSVLISNNGLDSLACNPISQPLRFKNHNGVLCQ